MPKERLPVTDFRGGLNVDSSPDNLADNQLAKADNVDLYEMGGLTKRKGTAYFNAVSYGAQVEQAFEWPRNDGSVVLLAVIGSNLCRVAENGTATIVQAVAAEKVGYFFLQDKLYFADGSNYYVYDGTTCAAAAPAADADLTNVKRCRFLVRHPKSSRIFAAGNAADQAALYFSQYGDPTYFKGSSVLYPTTGDGPVTGLSVFGDAVVVWFAHSVWVWRGIDPETDAVWVKVPKGQGASAGDTIQLTPNTMTFLGQGGLYAVAASLITGSGEFIPGLEAVKNLAEERVSSIIQDIANPAIAAGVWDMPRGRYLLAYRDTDAPDARNNRILVLNWHLGGFTRYIGIQANDFCLRGNGDLLVASNNYLLK
jgi:hypothetical protein